MKILALLLVTLVIAYTWPGMDTLPVRRLLPCCLGFVIFHTNIAAGNRSYENQNFAFTERSYR